MLSTGHCKKLAPTWSELADSYKGSEQVAIAQVDCTTAQDVCKTAAVTGYPTLKAFYSGTEHAVYRGVQAPPAHWLPICQRNLAGSTSLHTCALALLLTGGPLLDQGPRSLDALKEFVDGAVTEVTTETTQ